MASFCALLCLMGALWGVLHKGSHKSNLDVRTHLDTSDAATCPLAEPVFAEAGDVVIVST